jgi:hypothetical protein
MNKVLVALCPRAFAFGWRQPWPTVAGAGTSGTGTNDE